MSLRVILALTWCALVCLSSSARAADRLRGVVLSVSPQTHQALIRHEPYGGMPAMSMMFTVPASPALQPGERIEAAVDGETLSNVHVIAPAPAAAVLPLDEVPQVAIGDALPPGRFIDQTGRPFSFTDFRGKQVVLAFIYSRCNDPKMCPLISANFERLQDILAPGSFHLVELTLDPGYDTPAVLATYGKRFGANPAVWTIGTGPSSEVLRYAARFGITEFPDRRVGLVHNERTVLVDRDGRVADMIDQAGWDPQEIAQRLRAADNLPSNPIARLDYELSKAAVAMCGNRVAGYSGLLDLAIVLAILAAFGWLAYRLARAIFSAPA